MLYVLHLTDIQYKMLFFILIIDYNQCTNKLTTSIQSITNVILFLKSILVNKSCRK